jgi:hypothetical protein
MGGDEGQRQVPVRDCHTERSGRGSGGIDVDPLLVLGDSRETVDTLLVDKEPPAGTEFVTDGA